MKNMNTNTANTVTVVDLVPAMTLQPLGEVLVNLRKQGGSHTVTAKIADAVCGCPIDVYHQRLLKIRALALDLDAANDTHDMKAIVPAEDALAKSLGDLYNAACMGLFPDRSDMKYCIKAIHALRKGKDELNEKGEIVHKGTKDFRPVSDTSYVKAIENLIATRIMGQAWDEHLNDFRQYTPDEIEKMKKRVARYYEKKAKQEEKTEKPAPEKKTAKKATKKTAKKSSTKKAIKTAA